jgi:hypothetical protein
LGFPDSSTTIVPAPQDSCTPFNNVIMGLGGSAEPSLGPTIIRLPSFAPPRKRQIAVEIFLSLANDSTTSGRRSPSCSLRTKTLPSFASEYCIIVPLVNLLQDKSC